MSFENVFFSYSYQTHEELTEFGIPCTVILDAAVGYVMEKIDMVLCGAEGVVESGGIINKVNEPQHDKTNKITCAPSKDSDQTGQSLCCTLNG